MATLREYFDNDFPFDLNVAKQWQFEFKNSLPLEMQVRLHLDFISNAKYVSCYFPDHPETLSAFVGILQRLNEVFDYMISVGIQTQFTGEIKHHPDNLPFTGRVYFYFEANIALETLNKLLQEAAGNSLSLCFRGTHHAAERSKFEKPLAFICHDSRDKESVAKSIAIGLSKVMCPVWYDEFSLKVGDRLRESIEKGLKECKKTVLIISQNFLQNPGWTKTEFNSVFTRERIQNEDLFLPVWVGVTKEQIFDYCPSLADRYAVRWEQGLEEVIRQLHGALQQTSK